MGEVSVCGLDEGLDGRDDACRRLALESLGLKGLDNKGEDLAWLREDGLVLSVVLLDVMLYIVVSRKLTARSIVPGMHMRMG